MMMSLAPRPRLLCLLCQCRSFSTSYRRLAEEAKPQPKKFVAPAPLENAPRAYGKRLDKFTPVPLPRPIGMSYPPEPGQNTGIDSRTFKQRHADLVNWEKHLEKRKYLTSKYSRPYFRDWSNMQFHKGKTFIAPPRCFKSDLSLYFPNLYGRTLSKDSTAPRDTTPTIMGKVSVVAMFSSQWAEQQTASFVSPEVNPGLHAVLDANRDRSQLVRVNVEEDWLKYLVIRLNLGGLRRKIGEENWERYFIVRRGLSDEIRESCGMLNSKVGYVYLLDSDCRIRWAGSGPSEDHERQGLVKGLERILVEDGEEREKSNSLKTWL